MIGVAGELGLSTAEFTERLRDPATAAEIESNCQSAVGKGVFGTPTLLIDNELFWGNDRLPLVRHHISKLG